MPPRNNSLPRLRRGAITAAPPVMTWKKASLVLVVAGVFDAVRTFFSMFWFFGPALAASAITIPLGVIMANATSLFGYLTIGMLVLMTNARILKTLENGILKFSASAGVGAIPIIGALPVFTFTIWRLYRTQIRLERVAYKKWEEKNAAAQRQQRNEQIAWIQANKRAEFMRQETADAAAYEEEQAQAAEAVREEIPEDEKTPA